MLKARFSTLARILRDLGFTARTLPGEYTRFDLPGTKAWFLYPDYADDEEVHLYDLVGTRYILDYRGMMSREEFEQRLKADLVAG